MPAGHVYTLRAEIVVSTAITVLQLEAGAITPFEIVSASVTQRLSTTSAQAAIAFVRKTADATVTAAVLGTTLFKLRPGDPNPDLVLGTAATGHTATVEGTDGDIFHKEGFNVLNGWKHLPVPEERILVRAATTIGLKFIEAPASHTWEFMITIRELG